MPLGRNVHGKANSARSNRGEVTILSGFCVPGFIIC